MSRGAGMVVTDLDGTLLDARSRLSPANRERLVGLAAAGIVCVVATGRSWYSARSVLVPEFPIDYLVFSSGAGIVDWSRQELIYAQHMEPGHGRSVIAALRRRNLDFMLHHLIPENHHFHYFRDGKINPDFDDRCARYSSFAHPWDEAQLPRTGISQFVAVEPADAEHQYSGLVAELGDLKVILTTSPLDGRSRWIEIFPRHISKANASNQLCERHGIETHRVMAIGNDYNDLDLLDWSEHSFAVGNSVSELLARYEVVASNDEDGFAQAVDAWLPRLSQPSPVKKPPTA